MKKLRYTHSAIFVIIFIWGALGYSYHLQAQADPAASMAEQNNGVAGMQQLYQYIETYRFHHHGMYPGRGKNSLSTDMMQHYATYGFANSRDALNALISPDNKYADPNSAAYEAPDRTVSYFMFGKRPDGKALGKLDHRGEKDIIAATDIYRYYHTTPSLRTGSIFSNPSGYYLTLSADGQIDRIPYDAIYMIPISQHDFINAFPEQAGVPMDCITYAEFYTMHGDDVLIGKPTANGNDINILDNGGSQGLVMLSRLLNYPNRYGIDRHKMWQVLDPSQEVFSLNAIQAAAAKLGMSLQKKVISLETLQNLQTPAMLYLKDTDIVTTSTIDDNQVIIDERGRTQIVDRADLAKRYGGEALIASSANTPSSLQVDQPIRTLHFASKDAEVTQNIKITNHGAKLVSLMIERPLCGITKAKLSPDKLAPGESANLQLHFKWRTILPGDHQSTFVTLKTDDPVQPRLQLGFDLKLAKGK